MPTSTEHFSSHETAKYDGKRSFIYFGSTLYGKNEFGSARAGQKRACKKNRRERSALETARMNERKVMVVIIPRNAMIRRLGTEGFATSMAAEHEPRTS